MDHETALTLSRSAVRSQKLIEIAGLAISLTGSPAGKLVAAGVIVSWLWKKYGNLFSTPEKLADEAIQAVATIDKAANPYVSDDQKNFFTALRKIWENCITNPDWEETGQTPKVDLRKFKRAALEKQITKDRVSDYVREWNEDSLTPKFYADRTEAVENACETALGAKCPDTPEFKKALAEQTEIAINDQINFDRYIAHFIIEHSPATTAGTLKERLFPDVVLKEIDKEKNAVTKNAATTEDDDDDSIALQPAAKYTQLNNRMRRTAPHTPTTKERARRIAAAPHNLASSAEDKAEGIAKKVVKGAKETVREVIEPDKVVTEEIVDAIPWWGKRWFNQWRDWSDSYKETIQFRKPLGEKWDALDYARYGIACGKDSNFLVKKLGGYIIPIGIASLFGLAAGWALIERGLVWTGLKEKRTAWVTYSTWFKKAFKSPAEKKELDFEWELRTSSEQYSDLDPPPDKTIRICAFLHEAIRSPGKIATTFSPPLPDGKIPDKWVCFKPHGFPQGGVVGYLRSPCMVVSTEMYTELMQGIPGFTDTADDVREIHMPDPTIVGDLGMDAPPTFWDIRGDQYKHLIDRIREQAKDGDEHDPIFFTVGTGRIQRKKRRVKGKKKN